RHHFGLDEVVASEAALALEPATPAPEGKPADTGVRHAAAGDGESVLLRRGVDRSPPRSALDAGDALFGVDVDAVECAEADADTTVDHRRAGHTVAAAVDGERDVLFPGDVDGGGGVGRARAPAAAGRGASAHPGAA